MGTWIPSSKHSGCRERRRCDVKRRKKKSRRTIHNFNCLFRHGSKRVPTEVDRVCTILLRDLEPVTEGLGWINAVKDGCKLRRTQRYLVCMWEEEGSMRTINIMYKCALQVRVRAACWSS